MEFDLINGVDQHHGKKLHLTFLLQKKIHLTFNRAWTFLHMDSLCIQDCQNKGQRERSETSQVYRSQVVQVSVVECVHDQVLPGAGR